MSFTASSSPKFLTRSGVSLPYLPTKIVSRFSLRSRARFYPSCPLEEFTSVDEVSEDITRLLADEKETEKRIQMQLKHVNATHSATISAEKLAKIYDELAFQ